MKTKATRAAPSRAKVCYGPAVHWEVGDEVWTVVLREANKSEPRRIGVVRAVGMVGFSVRLDKPKRGEPALQVDFQSEGYFPTRKKGLAWCKLNPGI